MTTTGRLMIAGVAAFTIGLAVALGIVLATDDGDGSSMPHAMDQNDSFMGMMAAMGSLDSDAMLTHMRDVLGEEGYQRMLTHFREHQAGGPMTGDVDVDAMMHRMMDGMMQHMPAGGDDILPPGNDEHHETPGPRMTPQR